MSQSIKKVPDLPAYLHTLNADFTSAETEEMLTLANTTLDGAQEKVYYIVDMRAYSLSLDDMITGANLAARGQKPALHHPNVIETIFVSSASMLRLAAKGLGTATFGGARVIVFDTLDEALAYCREKCASGQ